MREAVQAQDAVQRVIEVIARTGKLPVESVTLDKTFEELQIDSLDGINILFALESEFKIDIPDDPARQMRSVRDAADGVLKLLGLDPAV
jgi:acyl carrier protein